MDVVKTSSNGDWQLLLAGKVVFLTGGAGWIARHIAKTCYEHGARIVLADLNIETITKVKNETFGSNNSDDRILLVQIDVLNEETIEKAIQLTLNQWKTIDILVNTSVEPMIKIYSRYSLDLFFPDQRYLLLVTWKMLLQMNGLIFSMLTFVVMH